MTTYDLPEMLTAPLEKLYLQTKQLGYRLAQSFSPATTASISRNLAECLDNSEATFTSSRLLQLIVQVTDFRSSFLGTWFLIIWPHNCICL